ncbi:spondin domain-containing protein [Vibrio sp. 10N.222.51.C12]|uniref:spondin domain-containing protein n=1 Tax=unclassified Vibrio TaxID=2614977 RepID=UPI000C8206C7|nr:spondin domain-containing protein [Vibrio sp. 10N.286.48.B7]PMH80739.1 hypothetical protein BCU58_22910 [Vibrio sp. 10N.286.48.B7]
MKYKLFMIASSVALLAGCPDDSNNTSADTMRTYTVTVKNTTANQPMSPLAVLAHNNQYELFSVGVPVSLELEKLAESGSNSDILSLQATQSNVELGVSGNGLILPGSSDTVTFSIDSSSANELSLASMLVNTNDAFIGETGISLESLSVNERYEMAMNVWDAGTEGDSESSSTIPGPAGGGEGFNAARDDIDRLAFHAGVISVDDGLVGSALNASHRFASTGALLTIIRTK